MDEAAGLHDTDVVYVDTNPEQFEALPPTALHRPVDLEVVAADKEGASVFSLMSNDSNFLTPRLCPGHRTGYVRTYIVLPPTIYGKATGKLYDLGISNPHSIQIPLAIRTALDRGQGGMIGEGKNVWPHVELNECEFRSFNALWSI
jgi:hypothetical protein